MKFDKRLLVLLGGLGILLLGFFAVAVSQMNIDFKELLGIAKEIISEVILFLQKEAWLLFLGIAVLPTFMFPVSPLMIVSGTVFASGENTPLACLLAVSAASINMAWTYWVAAGPGYAVINKILKNSKFNIPKASGNNDFQLVAIVRLTGMPFPFQNFTLGLSHMSFFKYMIFSILVQAPPLCAFVYFGEAITSGKARYIFLAIAAIILLSVIAKLAPKYIKSRRNAVVTHG